MFVFSLSVKRFTAVDYVRYGTYQLVSVTVCYAITLSYRLLHVLHIIIIIIIIIDIFKVA